MAITSDETQPRVDPILLEAANLIREEGWIQFESYRPGRGYCISGAITQAVRNRSRDYYISTYDLTLKSQRKLGLGVVPLHIWNDAEGRTKEEVIKKLEDAAFGGGTE